MIGDLFDSMIFGTASLVARVYTICPIAAAGSVGRIREAVPYIMLCVTIPQAIRNRSSSKTKDSRRKQYLEGKEVDKRDHFRFCRYSLLHFRRYPQCFSMTVEIRPAYGSQKTACTDVGKGITRN